MTLAVLVVLVVALLLAVPGLDGVTNQLQHAEWGWVVAAVALEFFSGLGYVLTFELVFDRAPHRFARRLAWSEQAFQGAVSVGGAGGLGLGAWVLHTVGVSTGRIAERSAVFFILTSAVNVIVLVVFGVGLAVGVFDGPGNLLLSVVPAAVGIVVIALFILAPRFAGRLSERFRSHPSAASALSGLGDSIHDTEKLLRGSDWRLAGAFGYLLFDIAVLWACFEALGGSPPLAALVLAYQIGYLANVVPIPGGIGALDAGLVGALVLYGADAATSAAAVIVYHAIALWVPALVGTVAFLLLRRDLKTAPASTRLSSAHMFDHVTIRVTDRIVSERFYDTVLTPLGIDRTYRTPTFSEWRNFMLTERNDANPVTRRLHVGFAAPSREQVDDFWREGAEAGYTDDGQPGPRPHYREDYYGAFLLDPDGNSAEAVHHGAVSREGIVDHLWIRVADVAAAKRFYETIAPHAGLRVGDDTTDRVQFAGRGGSFSLVLGTPTEDLHMAFPTDDDGDVQRFHQAATEAGYRDNGPPGERPRYHPGYYSAYVLDPDGNNIEVVNHHRA